MCKLQGFDKGLIRTLVVEDLFRLVDCKVLVKLEVKVLSSVFVLKDKTTALDVLVFVNV